MGCVGSFFSECAILLEGAFTNTDETTDLTVLHLHSNDPYSATSATRKDALDTSSNKLPEVAQDTARRPNDSASTTC